MTNEFDQRQDAPAREKPDFAVFAKSYNRWSPSDLEMLWERNDEINGPADFNYFLYQAKKQDLDPIAGEIIPAYRWNPIKQRRMLVALTTIGVLRRRRATECDGLDQFTFVEGANGVPISASGTIYRKGCAKSFSATVFYDEYAVTHRGEVVFMWSTKSHMMLSKVLEAQLTRLAFYDLIGDALIDEETQREAEAAPIQPDTDKATKEEFIVAEKPNGKQEAEKTGTPDATAGPVLVDKKATTPVEAKLPEQPTPVEVLPIFRIVSEVLTDGTQVFTAGEVSWSNEEGATLRAQALANQYGKPFWVAQEGRPAAGLRQVLPPRQPAPTTAPTTVTAATAGADTEFDKLLTIMRARIGGETTPADLLIMRYFKTFLGVSKISKDRNTTIFPLRKLVEFGAPAVAALKADPEELGRRLSGRLDDQPDSLEKELNGIGWSKEARGFARKIIAKGPMSAAEFVKWIRRPIIGAMSVSSLENAALEIFLPLFMLVGGRAFEPIEFAVDTKSNFLNVLQAMVEDSGRSFEKWDEAYAIKVLDAIKQVAKPDDPLSAGLPFGN